MLMGTSRQPQHIVNPVLSSPNKLKLAVFSANCSHGSTMSDVPGVIQADWSESVAIAKAAEDAGFEALVPVARWKGMGGTTNFNHRNFETLTWAAGLAAVTSKIGVFSTTHIPTIHPVRAAKTAASIDHIAGGRFSLNVVAGWNEKEIGMFGAPQLPHDARYDVADEWIALAKALWDRDGEFDWEGEYFGAPGMYSEPKPVQSPGPVLMSAGNSPRGMRFAAQNCDLNFIAAPDVETAATTAGTVKALARDEFDREVKVFAQTYIICREDEDEAHAVYNDIAYTHGDTQGVRNLLDILVPNSSSADWEAMAPHLIAGYGSWPLVGTPQQVADGLIALADAGVDGCNLSWPQYLPGIEQFRTEILPRLIDAKVRAG
jgi:alkanesulfonate monooxygenase SsuD/methylene tetrahydromethanopterin reductase-like flavin-dependent oxidoreductase (luciferase family)